MKIILLLVCVAIGDTIGARLERASGGKDISIEEAPYFVSIQLGTHHVCGGTLISTRHVLTAAHCVLDPSLKPLSGLRVVSGEDKIGRAGLGHGIQNVSSPNGYREGRYWCDIAVVTLYFHVERNGKQKEIALPNAEIPYGVQATLVGFQLHASKSSNPGLQELTVQINYLSRRSDNPDVYDKVFYGRLTKPQSVNKADAGDAVVYNGRIVGIVSSHARIYRRGCYCVNVVKFKTFIEESMENTSPNSQRQSVIQWAPKRPRL